MGENQRPLWGTRVPAVMDCPKKPVCFCLPLLLANLQSIINPTNHHCSFSILPLTRGTLSLWVFDHSEPRIPVTDCSYCTLLTITNHDNPCPFEVPTACRTKIDVQKPVWLEVCMKCRGMEWWVNNTLIGPNHFSVFVWCMFNHHQSILSSSIHDSKNHHQPSSVTIHQYQQWLSIINHP